MPHCREIGDHTQLNHNPNNSVNLTQNAIAISRKLPSSLATLGFLFFSLIPRLISGSE